MDDDVVVGFVGPAVVVAGFCVEAEDDSEFSVAKEGMHF